MLDWIGRFGTVNEFWRVFTELNPETIRAEAERPFRLVLLGAPGSGKTTLAQALAGGLEGWAKAGDVLRELNAGQPALPGAAGETPGISVPAMIPMLVPLPEMPFTDLHVYLIDATRGVGAEDRAAIAALRRAGRCFVVFVGKCDLVANLPELQYNTFAALGDVPADRIAFGSATRREDVERVVAGLLLVAQPALRLALARRLPALRPAVADDVIVETARVNAEFALLSNLPANIPVVGGILGGGADFLVLTKNQVMMLFKLGAIHGRDLRSKLGLAAEVAPVVGNAFLWRTIARELVGMLPTVVAAVPRTAIGYAGTFVVGKMAQYYFAVGSRPSQALVQQFVAEANQRWRRLGEWRPQLR